MTDQPNGAGPPTYNNTPNNKGSLSGWGVNTPTGPSDLPGYSITQLLNELRAATAQSTASSLVDQLATLVMSHVVNNDNPHADSLSNIAPSLASDVFSSLFPGKLMVSAPDYACVINNYLYLPGSGVPLYDVITESGIRGTPNGFTRGSAIKNYSNSIQNILTNTNNTLTTLGENQVIAIVNDGQSVGMPILSNGTYYLGSLHSTTASSALTIAASGMSYAGTGSVGSSSNVCMFTVTVPSGLTTQDLTLDLTSLFTQNTVFTQYVPGSGLASSFYISIDVGYGTPLVVQYILPQGPGPLTFTVVQGDSTVFPILYGDYPVPTLFRMAGVSTTSFNVSISTSLPASLTDPTHDTGNNPSVLLATLPSVANFVPVLTNDTPEIFGYNVSVGNTNITEGAVSGASMTGVGIGSIKGNRTIWSLVLGVYLPIQTPTAVVYSNVLTNNSVTITAARVRQPDGSTATTWNVALQDRLGMIVNTTVTGSGTGQQRIALSVNGQSIKIKVTGSTYTFTYPVNARQMDISDNVAGTALGTGLSFSLVSFSTYPVSASEDQLSFLVGG